MAGMDTLPLWSGDKVMAIMIVCTGEWQCVLSTSLHMMSQWQFTYLSRNVSGSLHPAYDGGHEHTVSMLSTPRRPALQQSPASPHAQQTARSSLGSRTRPGCPRCPMTNHVGCTICIHAINIYTTMSSPTVFQAVLSSQTKTHLNQYLLL